MWRISHMWRILDFLLYILSYSDMKQSLTVNLYFQQNIRVTRASNLENNLLSISVSDLPPDIP